MKRLDFNQDWQFQKMALQNGSRFIYHMMPCCLK